MKQLEFIPDFYKIGDDIHLTKRGLVDLINHNGFKISFRKSGDSVFVKIARNGVIASIKVTGSEPDLLNSKAMQISRFNAMKHYGLKKIADEYLQQILSNATLNIKLKTL